MSKSIEELRSLLDIIRSARERESVYAYNALSDALAELARLRAEVARMRPVVEAARTWRNARGDLRSAYALTLEDAVDLAAGGSNG